MYHYYFKISTVVLTVMLCVSSCHVGEKNTPCAVKEGEVKLMVLDPGHFHADLLLKYPNESIFPDIYVYAPQGAGLEQHLNRLHAFNTRAENPTRWNPVVYAGEDYMQKMLENPAGNVVVLAGNNRKKTAYIYQALGAKIHVLADKPLAINPENFELLEKSIALAEKNGVMIYDMMTERFAVLNIIQRALMREKLLFGELEKGTPQEPAVKLESVHHFYKDVAGKPLIRPAWYYDVKQQGEGIVDVTTHLIDIVHWKCFPNMILDYKKDIAVLSASHWPTEISREQFARSTRQQNFPDYLQDAVKGDYLEVYANGDLSYRVKGTHVALQVRWNYEAPAGAGDTHTSIIRGTRAVIEVIQDENTGFIPELYLCPVHANEGFRKALIKVEKELRKTYPNIVFSEEKEKIHILVPKEYREAHEAHFAKVATTFFCYLKEGKMPEWEIPNLLAKYYITTSACQLANR